jgi:hypothetical protein
MDGGNESQPEEVLMGIIRGEYAYVPEEGVGEGADREGAREGVGEGEDKEDVSSFLNPSGDGMERENFDKGQTNSDDKRQLQTNTDGEVYILSLW